MQFRWNCLVLAMIPPEDHQKKAKTENEISLYIWGWSAIILWLGKQFKWTLKDNDLLQTRAGIPFNRWV